MRVFGAKTEWPIQVREESVIAIDVSVDPELRKETVGAVVHGAAVAHFVRQALGAAVFDGTAESQPLQPAEIGSFPRGKADPADNFGLIRSSAGEESLSIESAEPVFHATV